MSAQHFIRSTAVPLHLIVLWRIPEKRITHWSVGGFLIRIIWHIQGMLQHLVEDDAERVHSRVSVWVRAGIAAVELLTEDCNVVKPIAQRFTLRLARKAIS